MQSAARSLRPIPLALLICSGGALAQEQPSAERSYETVVQAPSRLPESPVSLSEFPATVQVVTREDVAKSGAVTLQEVLERLPGVHLNDEQGNPFQPDISIRGIAGSPVTGLSQGISVFVDGVRVNEPDAEEINFDLVPLDEVERIEIIRGPSAVFGRNTLAAAINVITQRGRGEPTLGGQASVGSFAREKYRLHAAGARGPWDFHFAATQFSERGFRTESDSRLSQVFAKLGYLAASTDLALSYQFQHDQLKQPSALPASILAVDRTTNFTAGDFFAPQLHQAALNVSQRLGAGFSLTANGFVRVLDAEQFNSNLLAQNTRLFNRTRSGGGILQLTHNGRFWVLKNHLVLGAEYAHDRVKVRVYQEQNDRSLQQCRIDPEADCPLTSLAADLTDHQNAVGLYLLDRLQLASSLIVPSDSVALTAGVRFDLVNHAIDDQSPDNAGRASGNAEYRRFVPTVGLNYNLSERYGVYVAYKEGFRAPAFLELTCAEPQAPCIGLQSGVAADPSFAALRPVKARAYEVGSRARPRDWLEASAALFRTDLADDIYSVSPIETQVYFKNVGDTRRQGIELSVRGTYRNWIDGYINYTYTRSTFETDFAIASPRTPGDNQEVRVGNRLPLSPDHRLNLGLQYRPLPWLAISATAAYVGEQYFRGDEENSQPRLNAYLVLGAGVRARWKSLVGFLSVSNLLNSKYETFGTFAHNGPVIEPFLSPGPPIRFLLGAGYQI